MKNRVHAPKLVHTETYRNVLIEVFSQYDPNREYYKTFYFANLDGAPYGTYKSTHNTYQKAGIALNAVKRHINNGMTEAERIEARIAELEAKIAELRNA